jgi:hypothetical protein
MGIVKSHDNHHRQDSYSPKGFVMSENLSAEKQAQPNLDSLSKKVKELEERENATTWWFAVGLAAFIILVSGDLGAKVMRSAPPALTGLLLTLTLGIEAATPNTN